MANTVWVEMKYILSFHAIERHPVPRKHWWKVWEPAYTIELLWTRRSCALNQRQADLFLEEQELATSLLSAVFGKVMNIQLVHGNSASPFVTTEGEVK